MNIGYFITEISSEFILLYKNVKRKIATHFFVQVFMFRLCFSLEISLNVHMKAKRFCPLFNKYC